MAADRKPFLNIEGIITPLIIAGICALMSIGLTVARYKVRNRLYRDLIYWRTDISNAIMSNCALSVFMVVNESGFETEGAIDFSFQLYKERNVRVVLNKEQKRSTQYANDSKIPQKQIQDKTREIYLGSPDEKTVFT